MISTRTDKDNLKESFFGPTIFVDSDNINSYKKHSSSIRSISGSDLSCKNIANSQDSKVEQKLHQAVMIAKLGFRNSRNDSQRGSRRNYNEQKSFRKANNFLRTSNQNSMVHKFKANLFSSSYILQKDQRKILESENYLEERKGRFHRVTELNKIFSCPLTNILMPGEKFTLVWDFLQLTIYLFSLWLGPMMASFGQNQQLLKGSEILINVFTIVEIIITLYRPIIISGEIIKEIHLIWSDYVINQLFDDFVGIAIWFMIYFDLHQYPVLNEIMAFVQVLVVIRKIRRKYDNQIENLYFRGFNSNFLDLITLFILIFYFAHMMACFWYYIGYQTIRQGSWITYYDVVDQSIWIKYNYSYYWAVITMVTVGYGDITARNQTEIAFVSIMVLFSSCMFAYSMNSIGVIVKNLYEQTNKIKRALILLNSFMQKSKVDPAIQNRVQNYLKFSVEQETAENNTETMKILSGLPAGLKLELESNIKTNIIQRIKLLKQFTQQTQNQVSQNLIQIKFTPQDIIYHRDERNDRHLYFISEGEVQIIEENSKKIIKQLKAGDTFGEYQFFTGQNTKESTISVGFTELYKIDRDKFQGLIKQNQKDFERFHKIKDVILYQKTFRLLQEKCSFCQQHSHLSIECPLLTYQPNIYLKICKNNKLTNQRGNLLRTGEKTKSLLIKQRIIQSVNEYQMHNSFVELDQQQEFSELISQNQNTLTPNQNEIFPNVRISDQLLKSLKSVTQEQLEKYQIDVTRRERNPTIVQFLKSKNKFESTDFEKGQKNNLKEILQLDQFQIKFHSIDQLDFEIMRNYSDYLPQNNVMNVIKLINRDKPKGRRKNQLGKGRSFGMSLYSPKVNYDTIDGRMQ